MKVSVKTCEAATDTNKQCAVVKEQRK